jgi:drug/metabolite transporter (DMT)-like permease
LTVYVLWGSTYLGIRVAVETIPPFLMAGVRFVIAGALLLAWRLPPALRAGKAPTAAEWRRALVIGAALLVGGNGLVAWAEVSVPSGVTALIVALVPLWMAIYDRFVLRRPMSGMAAAGLAVGFGGVALLVGTPGGAVRPLGALVLAVASISWAAGSLYSRDAKIHGDSLLATGMQMTVGGALLCLLGLFTGESAHLDLAAVSAASWVAFAYLVVFGGIVGFSAYLWLIREAPTALVSTYAYVNPLVAVFLGWAVLHERLTSATAIAAAVIVAGVAAIVSSRPPTPKSADG